MCGFPNRPLPRACHPPITLLHLPRPQRPPPPAPLIAAAPKRGRGRGAEGRNGFSVVAFFVPEKEYGVHHERVE